MTQALNLANFANNLNTAGATSNSGLQNSSVTVTAGTGMSGGGAVALGSSVTLTNTGVTSVAAGTGISVSASTGGVTITNSQPFSGSTSQLAKAWAQFTGATPPVLNGSFNVSSITRNATGYYTINFTTAMSNINYSAVMSGGTVISGTNSSQAIFTNNSAASVAPTTSSFTVTTGTAGWGAYVDLNWICVSVFGS